MIAEVQPCSRILEGRPTPYRRAVGWREGSLPRAGRRAGEASTTVTLACTLPRRHPLLLAHAPSWSYPSLAFCLFCLTPQTSSKRNFCLTTAPT